MIERSHEGAKIPMVLVGNKNDLEMYRAVDKEEGEQLAQKWKIPFLETSAKTRFNVEEAFILLVRCMKDDSIKKANTHKRRSIRSKLCVLT